MFSKFDIAQNPAGKKGKNPKLKGGAPEIHEKGPACSRCRARKVSCDRAKPCGRCLKAGLDCSISNCCGPSGSLYKQKGSN